MYLHDDAKLIYLAHPRTASNATADALLRIGFRKQDNPSDHHSQLHDHGKGSIITPDNRSEWLVFTTVRNHWDTVVSWAFKRYKSCDPPGWDAEDIEKLLAPNPWVKEHTLYHLHLDDADVILRYETLRQDLQKVLGGSGIRMPRLFKKNVSERRRGRKYHDLFTPEGVEYVGQRFKVEIDRLGYTY
jgi:hypothetical protein